MVLRGIVANDCSTRYLLFGVVATRLSNGVEPQELAHTVTKVSR